MTTRPSRTPTPAFPRIRIDQVWVSDWHTEGDAYEVQTEDGPRTQLPEHQPVVMCSTPAGRLYVHPRHFAYTREGQAEAHEFAERVASQGTINEALWTYVRGMYGTEAYEADGWADLDRRLDY